MLLNKLRSLSSPLYKGLFLLWCKSFGIITLLLFGLSLNLHIFLIYLKNLLESVFLLLSYFPNQHLFLILPFIFRSLKCEIKFCLDSLNSLFVLFLKNLHSILLSSHFNSACMLKLLHYVIFEDPQMFIEVGVLGLALCILLFQQDISRIHSQTQIRNRFFLWKQVLCSLCQ